VIIDVYSRYTVGWMMPTGNHPLAEQLPPHDHQAEHRPNT
jgi:hypothetical protein